MRFPDRASLNVFLFSLDLGALCAAGVFQLVPPLSPGGQFLFWPQDVLRSLHLHPHSLIGTRVMFVLLTTLLGMSIHILAGWPSIIRRYWSIARVGAGIVAILAPTAGWFLIGPRGSIPGVLLWTATVGWAFYATYCIWIHRRIRTWEMAVIVISYFGFWIYVYHSKIDPVMLVIPILACLSYLLWAPGVFMIRRAT